MIKSKLLTILPVFIAIGIILFTTLAVQTFKAPVAEASRQKIVVNWGHSDVTKSNKDYTPTFDYVDYTTDAATDTPVTDTDTVATVEEDKPAWVETDDTGLVNYAQSHEVVKTTKLTSTKWSLSGVSYKDYSAPTDVPEVAQANAKTYMKYQTLGYDSWNRQGHLARQAEAYTGDYSLRMIDGRILIAVGSYYCRWVGTYIDVLLEDGTVIPCIMGDAKSNRDTDVTNRYQAQDKSVVEFIIDSPGVNSRDYSYFKSKYPEVGGNFSNVEKFSSPVAGLRVYDKVYNINMSDLSNDSKDGR